MKIFLSLLFSLNGGGFGLPNKISKLQNMNDVLVNTLNNEVRTQINLILEVHGLLSPSRNLDDVVCAAAVLGFFGVDLTNHPYDRLAELFRQPLPSTFGNVLNHIIQTDGNSPTTPNYVTNNLVPNFGIFYGEMELFEQYIIASLQHNHPIVVQAWGNGANSLPSSSLLVTGIDTDSNADDGEGAWTTIYYCMDPTTGNIGTIEGGELISLGDPHNITITGHGIFQPHITKSLGYVIPNEEHGDDQLVGMERKEVQRYDEDLNYALQTKQIGQFRNVIDYINLSEFVGELYAFNYRLSVSARDFRIYTDILPETNPNFWTSEVIEIQHVAEDSGLAHREAALYVQISFSHAADTNHLIFTLIIFIAGDAWRTSLYGHVWFKTGNFLTFTKF